MDGPSAAHRWRDSATGCVQRRRIGRRGFIGFVGGVSATSGDGGSWFDADADAIWVLVAVAALGAAGLAVSYILWIAPALLAEMLVDAIIVGTVSRQMGLLERRDWTATVIRRTWLPAAVIVLTLMLGGWALQQAAPEARSIGPAVRTLLD